MLYAVNNSCPLHRGELPVKRFNDVTIVKTEFGATKWGRGSRVSEVQATMDEVLVINGAKLLEVHYQDRMEFKWANAEKSTERYYALIWTEGDSFTPPFAMIQRVSKEEAFRFLLYRQRRKMKIWNKAKAEILRKTLQNKKETVLICKTDSLKLTPENDIFTETVTYKNSDIYHVKRNAVFLRDTDEYYFKVIKQTSHWIQRIEYIDRSVAALLLGPTIKTNPISLRR